MRVGKGFFDLLDLKSHFIVSLDLQVTISVDIEVGLAVRGSNAKSGNMFVQQYQFAEAPHVLIEELRSHDTENTSIQLAAHYSAKPALDVVLNEEVNRPLQLPDYPGLPSYIEEATAEIAYEFERDTKERTRLMLALPVLADPSLLYAITPKSRLIDQVVRMDGVKISDSGEFNYFVSVKELLSALTIAFGLPIETSSVDSRVGEQVIRRGGQILAEIRVTDAAIQDEVTT